MVVAHAVVVVAVAKVAVMAAAVVAHAEARLVEVGSRTVAASEAQTMAALLEAVAREVVVWHGSLLMSIELEEPCPVLAEVRLDEQSAAWSGPHQWACIQGSVLH